MSNVNQILSVPGELRIEAGDQSTNGIISFRGGQKTQLGMIRSYGFSQFQNLVVDASECSGGLHLRTDANQGDSLIGGRNYQFALTAEKNGPTVTIPILKVKESTNAIKTTLLATPNLQVSKSNTTGSSTLNNDLATFVVDSKKTGEGIQMFIGGNTYSGGMVSGYKLAATSDSDVLNYGYLSIRRNGVDTLCAKLKTTGDVEIPTTLKAGTIDATTYLNLPPVNTAPLTLDAVNGHVGINKTMPTEALDVVGSIRATGGVDAESITGNNTFFSGTMSAAVVDTGSVVSTGSIAGATGDFVGNVDVGGDLSVNGGIVSAQLDVQGTITTGTINATTYLNLPTPDILPITLDKVNNRVGINNTTPNKTLDVDGEARVTGALISDVVIYPSGSTQARIKSGPGNPEGNKLGTPGSLWLRTDGRLGNQLYAKVSGTSYSGWEAIDYPFMSTGRPDGDFATPIPTAAAQFTLVGQIPYSTIPIVADKEYDVSVFMPVINDTPGTASAWVYGITFTTTADIVPFQVQSYLLGTTFTSPAATILAYTTTETTPKNCVLKTIIKTKAGATGLAVKIYAISTTTLTGRQRIQSNTCRVTVNPYRWY